MLSGLSTGIGNLVASISHLQPAGVVSRRQMHLLGIEGPALMEWPLVLGCCLDLGVIVA